MHGWTSRQRNAAIASFLSWTLDAFDFFLLVFLLSDIAHSFHVDLEEVTLAILLTLAVRPVGALIFGRAAEKFGRKPILMLNIVFFSAFELLSAAAPSLMLFFLLRVLYGVAMGGIWGVASSLAMETIPDRSRGLMSGLFQAGYPFGYLLAAVAYGLLFEQLGWRGMFVIGAAPVLLLPFIYFCVEESPVWQAARQNKESTSLLPVLRSHWKLCLYLVVLMAAFNFFSHGTQDLYPVFLKVQHGFEPKTVSIIAVCYNIASIIGGVFFGSLSEKIGRRKAIMIAALLALPIIPAGYLMYDKCTTSEAVTYMSLAAVDDLPGQVGGGEYLPTEDTTTDDSVWGRLTPEADDGVELTEYTKNGLTIQLAVQNTGDTEASIRLPLFYYPGYHMTAADGAALTHKNGYLTVTLAPGWQGSAQVRWTGMWFWRAADCISLLGIAATVVLYRKSQKNAAHV